MRFFALTALIILIGIPLWIWEKITGEQPEGLINWLDGKLTR